MKVTVPSMSISYVSGNRKKQNRPPLLPGSPRSQGKVQVSGAEKKGGCVDIHSEQDSKMFTKPGQI